MARDWNGLDLVDEFSALLGDTTSTFEARVLKWMNDIQMDVLTRHNWPYMVVKGKKLATASQEEQDLNIAAPGAPTVAAAAGGSLEDGSTYNVYITYVMGSNSYETPAGTVSADVAPTGANLTISVSDIPTSSETLVTARKVYLQKDSGSILFYSTISDNTTTTASITADATSTIEAPDFIGIKEVYGNPFIETSSQLQFRDIDQLRLLFMGSWTTGTPDLWSQINDNKIVMYPVPSSAIEFSYYYTRLPYPIYNDVDSQPTLPVYMKPVLKAGVIAMGYEYRDRSGQENKRQLYESLLSEFITRHGANKDVHQRVRDVVGDSDGFEV